MERFRALKGYMCDMDGVIYYGNKLLPGVKEFVDWLNRENKKYLFLTNNSSMSPRELRIKLQEMGLDVGEDHFYTSAQATAAFVSEQMPGCRAYVIGDPWLIGSLYEHGVAITDKSPDYVIIGESSQYNYDTICRAVKFVENGARLIGTNSDLTGPTKHGVMPACRALVSPIELATGTEAYYVGKPNPLMMRKALKRLGVHSAEAGMIGDRLDTDVIAGIETGMDTVLVLSGVTNMETLQKSPYRPRLVLNGVGDIAE